MTWIESLFQVGYTNRQQEMSAKLARAVTKGTNNGIFRISLNDPSAARAGPAVF